MKCNVSLAQASSDQGVLPARVQEALGQLVGSAKEGLLELTAAPAFTHHEIEIRL